ncbi:MAG: NTP/NDP exchange transporter, partial [Candidatus Zixiibacteriota bacterium]
MSKMKKLIPTLLGIQSGEGVRASLMFLYAMFLLSAYLILKPVRNSLFLEKFGPQELVYMYMIIAVFAAVIISAYTKVGARLGLKKYITATTLFLVTNLVAFWWLISQEYNWLVYVFYVWVSIFGAITTSQFWLLANHIFDAREAKRLFPFIGAGAITGGIIGSKLTGLLAETLGTEALLWICVGFLALIQTLLLLVWPLRAKDSLRGSARKRMKDADTRGMWPLVFRDKYLRLLTGCIALTVMVSTFVDFQFNWVVSETFEDKDARTAFFGDFFFYLSLLSLGMQLILSSRILRKFGVGAAILILPVGLLLGSAAIFTYPRLIWSAVLVKISDGSFRYSINKAGFELLYLPVASAIKNRVKGLMDVVG